MTENEKRKLFRKRWLQAFFSPFRRIKHGTSLESGVYDADDKRMRNIYFILKTINMAYLMFLSFFLSFFIRVSAPEGVGLYASDHPMTITHPLLLWTIFVPLYFIFYWLRRTFFLAAFDIDNNEKTAKGEAKDNLELKGLLQVGFVGWAAITALEWFRFL